MRAMACSSVEGFQSESYSTNRLAPAYDLRECPLVSVLYLPMMFRPDPPDLALNKKMTENLVSDRGALSSSTLTLLFLR